MKLGLVTVLFNSDSYLKGFFESLSNQTFQDYQLYLIDNTYSDSSKQFIDEQLSVYKLIGKTTYINAGGNVGVAKGNNLGIEESLKNGDDKIILLNNDIEFYDSKLFEILIKESANECIITTKINYFSPKETIWCAGGVFKEYIALTKHLFEDQTDNESLLMPQYVDYAPTCFMLFDKSVFEKVGRMDEKYFVYYDDTDFLYRCKKFFKIRLISEVVVYHKVSSSTGGNDSPFSIYYGHRNRIYFAWKNLSSFKFVTSYLYMLLTIIPKALKYDEKQRTSLFKGIKQGTKLIFS